MSSSVFAGSMDDLLINGIRNNDMATIKTAIDNGANVNYIHKGWNGLGLMTPLSHAICSGNKNIVSYLITKGADVNFRTGGDYFGVADLVSVTPLIQAIDQKSLDIATILIESGADISIPFQFVEVRDTLSTYVKSTNGNTTLIEALIPFHLTDKSLQFIQLLLAKGADVNQSNYNGDTPLMEYANSKGSLEPIFWYARDKTTYLSIAKVLLAAGADPNKVNKDGKTALQIAIDTNNKEMIDLLLPISPK